MSDNNLQSEVVEEYAKFVKTVFRRANEENSLKKKVYDLLEEYLDDEENRRNLTLGGLVKLLQEVNKSDNEFIVGILGAISKKGNEGGNPLMPVQPAKPAEKELNPGPSGSDSEDVATARRLLSALNEMQKNLKGSEK